MVAGVVPAGPLRSILASPKSMILIWPRVVTKMLAGLMSRCTTPSVCAASSASAICTRQIQQFFQRERLVRDLLAESAGPPDTPSPGTAVLGSSMSYSVQMFG